ncbi:hypothetical protein COLO4_14287 [Corchorus olitorius]|uniref:Cytosine-specific methyltransferase n=1 Tax=Corchorus olitorius TaxID=93759 RepID=A0A1R3JSN2_9ROSI|nr:hypothetical protein COLO4_14287 [Corchorus olitorius]
MQRKRKASSSPATEARPSKLKVTSKRKASSSLATEATRSKLKVTRAAVSISDKEEEQEARFLGEPVPEEEARRRWPKRYDGKKKLKGVAATDGKDEDEEITQAQRHYTKAEVDGVPYDLYDDAHVNAEGEQQSYIAKIVEMFEGVDGTFYFTAQWYYRAGDTVMKKLGDLIDGKRVFFSEVKDDNPLDCLVKKLTIAKVSLNVDLEAKEKMIPSNCDYYCDMFYHLKYSSFTNLPKEDRATNDYEASSTIFSDNTGFVGVKASSKEASQVTLLDLYSGCGAMSSGLCLGANMAGLKLVTRWAVDLNKDACESLKWNHPETEVRNESADDFLALLKEWKRLCDFFSVSKPEILEKQALNPSCTEDGVNDCEEGDTADEVYEVEKILAIRYINPDTRKSLSKKKDTGKSGLQFKVRWKNYGPKDDSWEPLDGLGDCEECLKDFVTRGFQSKILPLPGDVDVICGGPPCQGMSGFNRFRNKEYPLKDEKNRQLKVYMETVEYLKPKYVLMENVVDIVKFAEGYLGRYSLAQLIHLNYQVRMGMMSAGSYGLPQFRMRVFLWGARPSEKLPQYPLPTHDVVVRGVIPVEFEMNTVAYKEGQLVELEKKLFLENAISDLPAVENNEGRDEMDYVKDPQTEFQRFIRLRKQGEMPGSSSKEKLDKHKLYDHRPLELNNDDYKRVCLVPKRKGANFRDLKGVLVRGKKVELDPTIDRVYLESGKPLVPNYAISFVKGSSTKPFARLWWDETVPTVVTRAEPHNQAIMHPEQDRVLTVRENARLQGFPDYYRLFGDIKERYIQVGNAVAVPVARALGYALGLAYRGQGGDEPVLTLPQGFPNI